MDDDMMPPEITMQHVAQAGADLSELSRSISAAAGMAKRVGAAGMATACYLLSEAIDQYQKELVKFALKVMEDD